MVIPLYTVSCCYARGRFISAVFNFNEVVDTVTCDCGQVCEVERPCVAFVEKGGEHVG